jgi:hypothetical protein
MGLFTSWREAIRGGERLDLTPQQVNELVESTCARVGSRLRQKFPGRVFGEDTGDELALEMSFWLAEAIRGNRDFPDGVNDSESLYFALVNKASKRSYDRYRARSRRAGLQGGSGFAVRDKDGEVSAQTFAAIADSARRGGPTFDEVDEVWVGEVIQNVFDDLVAIEGGDDVAVSAYQMAISKCPKEQIAETLGRSPSSVNRYLREATFCMMRRLEYAPWQLKKEFGDEADHWLKELQNAGRE